jgi:CRP-like cAMP-binding protein
MTPDLTAILGQTELLRSAPAEELGALAAASRVRTFRRGQVVFTRGDPADTVIVVVSGRVKVVVRSADGGALTLAIIGPGGVFGELGAADSGPRSSDAETLDECQLLLVPREAIQEVCARIPSVARALTDATADLIFLDLPRRVAKKLLSQPSGDDGAIRLKLSQEDLAHQVGGTRQSVNAALRGFERRGWIEVHDRTVTVKQAAALSRFVGTELSAS